MWEDEDCSLSPAKNSDDWDSGGYSKTFRHSFRPTSPLSLADFNMWDTKSRFTAQSSAWCGMASVSGTGFLSKVSTSTSGSTGGFRQHDPGMRRWNSMSRLAPEGAPRSFSPSPGAELRAALEESSFRRAELVQRLREAHERLDSQTDLVKTKDTQMHHSITTAQLLDMKHKQLAEAVSALEQEKEAAELSRFEESRQRGELHEKVLQLEMDMLHMRSTLERGSTVQLVSIERTPNPLSRTPPVTQEDFYQQVCTKADRELSRLREALREAEARANTQDEERSHALQQLQTSTEAQSTLLSQLEEMNQRLSHTMQGHTEVQKQLSEANSKLSQACLEKAILSTQVLKLEDNIKDLKAKLSGALSDKDRLIQEKAELHQRAQGLELQLERAQRGREGFTEQVCELHDQLADAKSHNNKQDQETVLMKEDLMSVKEVNEKLTCELEMVKQRLEISQSELHELTAEKVINTNRTSALEAERTQLIGEKEELLGKMNEGGQAELTELKEKCCQLRESWDAVELENQKLQDRCLCLESEVLEKEEKLHLQVEEYQKLEAERVQSTEELRAVASHWNEKWQEVALTLHSTQAELEELKKNDTRNKLQDEAARLATEVEKLHREKQKDKEEIESLLQHKANMETVLNRVKKESDSLLRVELDACKQELELERSRSQALLLRCKGKGKGGEAAQTQDKETVGLQSSEVQRLEQQLAERDKELRGKEHALKSLERLREAEKTEARVKISALELKLVKGKGKASGDGQDDGGQAEVLTTDSLRAQLEESRRRTNQLQQEKSLAVQRLQTLRQLHLGKDEKTFLESKTDKTVCPVNPEQDKQRRMLTEQLKSLFKVREGGGQELEKVDDRSAAAQTGACSLQDWAPKSKVIKNALDTLHSQRRRQQLLGTGGRNRQQRAGLMPVSEEQEEEEAKLRFLQPIQGFHAAAPQLPAERASEKSSGPSRCPGEADRQGKLPSLGPDGIFLARLVDICSPDEDEEEEEDKRGTS
uniref:uncharacterized protein n=1 Tax=Centroberyx gerrardi TaxID=166262 RepID=UPI003AAA500E